MGTLRDKQIKGNSQLSFRNEKAATVRKRWPRRRQMKKEAGKV